MNLYVYIREVTLADPNVILSLFQDTIHYTCREDYTETQIAAWISSTENQGQWKKAIEHQFFIVAE